MSPSPVDTKLAAAERTVDFPTGWMRLAAPAAVALAITAVVLAVVVALSPSTFALLGAGRGLVEEDYYPAWGFVLVLGTVVAQVIAWVAGSALVFYLLTLAGRASGWGTVRLATTLVYLGLIGVPLLLYHALFGGWLLGLGRADVSEWLLQHYPDAHWLLIGAHIWIDLALIPLTIAFLAVLWRLGERIAQLPRAQTLLWLVVCLAALAVALSLTIHSTLVHLRFS